VGEKLFSSNSCYGQYLDGWLPEDTSYHCSWTEHHATKAYWGSGGITPRILDLCAIWKWVVSFTPRQLYPQGKSPWYPLDRSLGGPQSRFGRGGEEKNSQLLWHWRWSDLVELFVHVTLSHVAVILTPFWSQTLAPLLTSRKLWLSVTFCINSPAVRDIWSCNGDDSSRCLLGCEPVWLCGRISTFRRSNCLHLHRVVTSWGVTVGYKYFGGLCCGGSNDLRNVGNCTFQTRWHM
jgi:hypothetical protein